MAPIPNNEEAQEHRPARSGTPTAWMTLALLAALILGILFFDSAVCGVMRVGMSVLAWKENAQLSIDHLSFGKEGTLQAQGVSLYFGSQNHRSSWKSDWMEIKLSGPVAWIGGAQNRRHHLLHEISLGKTRVFLDHRSSTPEETTHAEDPIKGAHPHNADIPWIRFLPEATFGGPLDIVVIGDLYRFSIAGLYFSLPDRWAGRVAYSEAVLDIGSAHHVFSATSASANWNGSTLRLGKLELERELKLEEITLTPFGKHLEFGLRGTVGEGLLRGDGSIGILQDHGTLAATLVGEGLKMEVLSMLLNDGDQRASGTIRQGRFTFRGDPERPLEADSSVRLVADDFRWEGRGWDSLRLAATLTGRVFTLSELVLLQKANEVTARGQSKLPEDWHHVLKAPFTASFQAQLEDAGELAALAGPDFAQLAGRLELEGALRGAENKAEGYCNLVGTGMKISSLPIDWLKGCLLFEGEKTRLSNLEAWSGKDRIMMEGSVENARPHTYAATAQFDIGNLTRRLAQIGISTAAQIGGGAVRGTWSGDGSIKGHSGNFEAKVNDWISPWTSAGMSGSFQGTYSPGHLYCSKAEFQAQDLRLGLQFSASPTRLEAKSIVAARKGKIEPLVQGEISLPVNAPALWQSGDIVSNLGMKDPLTLQLGLQGIKVEELADLLGQKTPLTGNLEGNISVSGTPESPEVHSMMKIAKLTLPDSTAAIGMALSFNASAGRATCQIVQDSAKEPPLSLHAEIPFRLMADRGRLLFADGTAPVHATATLHRAPVSEWLSHCYGSSWVIRDGLLDGDLSLGGTLDRPSLEGKIAFGAREVVLSGLPALSNLQLPILCALDKATVEGGTALSGSNQVTLSGSFDWSSNPWTARLDLSGKGIEFPKVADLDSRGNAEVSLLVKGTNIPSLTGNLSITELGGNLALGLMPSFVPPGMDFTNCPGLFLSADRSPPVSLDLRIQTEKPLSIGNATGTDPVQVQADFHLMGAVGSPRWSGSLIAKDADVELPGGRFFIPEATLDADNQGMEHLSFTAYGLTRSGYCTIQHTGSLHEGDFTFGMLAPDSLATSADVLLALNTSTKGPSPVQIPAWVRQNMLFPASLSGWVDRRMGVTSVSALGFYGKPWSMTFQQLPAQTSLRKEGSTTRKK